MSALITYKLEPRINPVSSSPFPLKRGTFVLFELFVFKRRISCSQEESRILQSLPVQAWNIRVIRVIRVQKKNPVFTRKLSVFPSACKNNKNPLILQAIMRKITHIIIHCTATRADRSFSVQSSPATAKSTPVVPSRW